MTQGLRRRAEGKGVPLPPPGQDFSKGTMRLTFSEQPPRSGWEQGLLGVQEKPSPSKPSRQRHLGQVNEGPPVSLWERPEAEGTDTHSHGRGREEMQRSPGDAPLADAAGVQVAVLGPLCGPTVSYGLVTEAAAKAWGTCALLAHPPAAWTVVTETVDTAAVCREDMVTGKVRGGRAAWGEGAGTVEMWKMAASAATTSGSQNQGQSRPRRAGRGNARGPFVAFSHPILAALPLTPPSESSSVCLT